MRSYMQTESSSPKHRVQKTRCLPCIVPFDGTIKVQAFPDFWRKLSYQNSNGRSIFTFTTKKTAVLQENLQL